MNYISEAVLKGIAFLGVQRDGQVVPGGTTFVIDVPVEDDNSVYYLVTARHVLEESQAETLYLMANLEDGNRAQVEIARADWVTHDREDVAVYLMGRVLPVDNWNPEPIPFEFFLSNDHEFVALAPQFAAFRGQRAELGDEVIYIGLSRESAGRERNFPVARFGRLARKPGEPLTMKRWGGAQFTIEGFLIETISWGGFSGSPVLWRRPVFLPVLQGDKIVGFQQTYISGLLGLLSGHYDIPTRIRSLPAAEEQANLPEVGLNSGLGVVTPISALRSLLEREDVVADRRQAVQGE